MTQNTATTIPFAMTPEHWALLQKTGAGHKYTHGHAVIMSGPYGQGGAARLAARGALRIGAGVVSILCARQAMAEHVAHLDAIMVKPIGEAADVPEQLAKLKTTSICVGPNLGFEPYSHAMLTHALSAGVPLCLDADAISLVASGAVPLPAGRHLNWVMTPHEGELRRLVPDVFTQTSCRISQAQYAAEQTGCIVLFKGPQTIIAGQGQTPVVVSSNAYDHTAWLATAGSGDVLAGFITGLLARGIAGFDAAAIAADLHFRCADAHGPGLIAEDIPEMIPHILR